MPRFLLPCAAVFAAVIVHVVTQDADFDSSELPDFDSSLRRGEEASLENVEEADGNALEREQSDSFGDREFQPDTETDEEGADAVSQVSESMAASSVLNDDLDVVKPAAARDSLYDSESIKEEAFKPTAALSDVAPRQSAARSLTSGSSNSLSSFRSSSASRLSSTSSSSASSLHASSSVHPANPSSRRSPRPLDKHPSFVKLSNELLDLKEKYETLKALYDSKGAEETGNRVQSGIVASEQPQKPQSQPIGSSGFTSIPNEAVTSAKLSQGAPGYLFYSSGRKYPPVKILNSAQRKRILITGGAGFVGSHLTDVLMKQGHEVTVMDNFFTGRKRNIEHWIGHPNFELAHHDVVEPYMIEVDEIYHLASPASPPHYMYNPIKTIKTNSVGTINMLGLAHRVGARLLLASTSEIYGDPEVHPQVETYRGNVNTIGPRACYDEAKRIAETLCVAYKHQANVQVRIARIFNTFGPRMNLGDGRVVSNFVMQALQGKSLSVYGSGNQTRSFQYVSDLVAGLVALMNGNYSYPVNIGNPDEYTMLQFAREIIELTNSSSEITFKPLPKDDPMRRRPDISRAKAKIGWQPKQTVRYGLAQAIKYFAKELKETGDPEALGSSHKAGPYSHLKDYEKNSQVGGEDE